MLRVPDTWKGFAEQYVRALDELCDPSTRQVRRSVNTEHERANALADWHSILLENLVDTEDGLLDRIAGHAALGGPEHMFLARGSRTGAATPTSRASWDGLIEPAMTTSAADPSANRPYGS